MSIKGDIGAPLFTCRGNEYRENNKPKCDPVKNVGWVLEGLASWTTNPCGYNFPGVYTKIDDYVDWINSYIYPAASTTTPPKPTTTTKTPPPTTLYVNTTTTAGPTTTTKTPPPTTLYVNTTTTP